MVRAGLRIWKLSHSRTSRNLPFSLCLNRANRRGQNEHREQRQNRLRRVCTPRSPGKSLGLSRNWLRREIMSRQSRNNTTQQMKSCKASAEEGQSANEELQSINEELETSKEELESTNEELTTVNEEMANRNTELSRLNSDLINLQTSTQLVIVWLGRDLAIRRFSVQAQKQFSLLAADVGRPITGLRHNL